VFVRRVAITFDWVGRSLKKIAGRDAQIEPAVTARLDALKKQKVAMDESMERRRASVRFEPTSIDAQTEFSDPTGPAAIDQREKPSVAPANEKSYTERLLEAKRKANKNK
jgi:hypothetical protein